MVLVIQSDRCRGGTPNIGYMIFSLITGILAADQGEIVIDGGPVQDKKRIAKLFGVGPEGRGFYGWMTAREYLCFFADLYGIQKKNQDRLVTALLSEVDLLKRCNSTIGTYSRGMKQRLGLARALVNNPKILVLDEPTLGLDSQGQVMMQQLLKKLSGSGVTIFL